MNERIRPRFSWGVLGPKNACITVKPNTRDTRQDGTLDMFVTRDADFTWREGGAHLIFRRKGSRRVTLEVELPQAEAEALRDYLNYAYPKEEEK